jgi:hypothetical protein
VADVDVVHIPPLTAATSSYPTTQHQRIGRLSLCRPASADNPVSASFAWCEYISNIEQVPWGDLEADASLK